MNSERMVSIHGDSYEKFWFERFPSMLEDSLSRILDSCKNEISFSPEVSELELHFHDDISADATEALCQELNLDYTQGISCRLRFDKSSDSQIVHLGRIPKQTREGNFIINGKERSVIAQLMKSPGLTFHREEVVRKYTGPDGSYAVDKVRYSARLIPRDGVWLEFEIFKTLEEQESLLPVQIWNKARKVDGHIRVRIRRDKWFSVLDLLLALGVEPAPDMPLREPNPTIENEEEYLKEPAKGEEREYLIKGDGWHKIGQCIGIKAKAKSGDELSLKKSIKEEILDRNYLSELGRYQVNRRLSRIGGCVAQTGLYLAAADIEGICVYLVALCKGRELPVDDEYSLAGKRVRRIGDLLEEEVIPHILRRIERSVKKRVGFANKDLKTSFDAGEFAKLIERAALASDNFLNMIKKQLFTAFELSHIVPREGLLERKAIHRRITLFGPGGLSSKHVKKVRDIHWTHYGRLCPVDTPQSDHLGLTLSIPLEARINRLGLIEVPLREVIRTKDGDLQIQEDEAVYLSAAQEEDETPWIAYFDQQEALSSGRGVWARCGSEECRLVDCQVVRYIDAFPHQQFSLAARLVPFLQHNDANRVLMACSAMRQALPINKPEAPLIQTGYETLLTDGGGAWSFGKNLLVAYMPYKGLNFEDAVLVSESASGKLVHVRHFDYSIEIKEYTVATNQGKGSPKRKTVRQEITRDIHCSDTRKKKLDEYGIIKKGEWVETGDILVGIVDSRFRESISLLQMAARALSKRTVDQWDYSFRVPKGERGRVVDVDSKSAGPGCSLPKGVWKIVKIRVESAPRPLQVGDKVANRHGGKGVVSAIQTDEKMPYFNDPENGHEHNGFPPHTHVEMIMNPLGVVSRLNLGQLYETHLGWFAHREGGRWLEPVPPFSDSIGLLRKAYHNNPAPLDHNGKVHLTDPLTKKKTLSPVTIGFSYILKLNHLAEEKVHGRGFARHKYSVVSQQPLEGKRREGGQRMGEMEIWALEAYNARHIIQEMLTLKSDNPIGRELLYQAQKAGVRFDKPYPGLPEVLKVLTLFLLSCGLKLELLDGKEKPIDFLGSKWPLRPERVSKVSIKPVSRLDIEHLSAGPITNPDTGTEEEGYKNDGIFSQTVFGPILDWTCGCGTIHPYPSRETERCKSCGVEITLSEARRQRIGHIEIPKPVFNVVFMPVASRLLGVSVETLKRFLIDEPHVTFTEKPDALLFLSLLLDASEEFRNYFEKRLKLERGSYNSNYLSLKELLGQKRLNFSNEIINKGSLKFGSSIILVGKLLSSLTEERLREIRRTLIDELSHHLREQKKATRQEQLKRRLEVIDAFLRSRIPVSHLMIEVMPVLPPGLRPPLVTEERKMVMGDLNCLYQNLLRFLKAREWKSQAGINRSDMKELQRHISAIIDNRKVRPPLRRHDGKAYVHSLAHFLKGKKGFFRSNLLGKRVDYSGRAVIVPDLDLDLDQCGLPYVMAVEIFIPLLFARLRDFWAVSGTQRKSETLSDRAIEARIRRTLKLPLDDQDTKQDAVEDRNLVIRVLNEIGTRNPVLFNRQPTLHRIGVQAFYPKVNSHNAISMHPLVTAGFNADFDGDTAAIHRVITIEALEEVKGLLAHNNLFSPANGSLTLNLGQDVALGAYILTASEQGRKTLAKSTGYSQPKMKLNRKELSTYLRKALLPRPTEDRIAIAEDIKRLFFSEATSSGLSLSIIDLPDLSAERDELMADKRRNVADVLNVMQERVLGFFQANPDHPLAVMHDSGARGDTRTMTQLVGMRGPVGKIGAIDQKTPPPVIVSSLREGMKTGEYFVSCYGSRTTLVDKKMGTADAGYVTRKLVEITHQIYVSSEDCRPSRKSMTLGLEVSPYAFKWFDMRDLNPEYLINELGDKFISTLLWEVSRKDKKKPLFLESVESLFNEKIGDRVRRKNPQEKLLGVKIREERSKDELLGKLMGRVLLNPIELEGKVIHHADTDEVAGQLAEWILSDKRSITVRSPLTCEADHGVCQQCYGLDLTTMKLPEIGSKAGIIAAQSIGEPGTQLVLRTFHSGGVMGMAGISQDIPKVERFLNAKSLAQIEAVEGNLTEDSYPAIIDEIKGIYEKNGIKISDQHFEILVKGMLSKFCITEPGLALFYPGKIVEKEEIASAGGEAKAQPVLSDIRSLKRSPTSWLSAASFENAMEILAMAAIGGKKDRLLGLKENVILGRLLPPDK